MSDEKAALKTAVLEMADAFEELPDEIAIYRAIKYSRARSQIEIAKAVVDHLRKRCGHIPAKARALASQEVGE